MTRPKRPRDPSQLAKFIVDVATGEASDQKPDRSPHPGNSEGGKARARNLAPHEREAIARKAASARWKKDRPARETTE